MQSMQLMLSVEPEVAVRVRAWRVEDARWCIILCHGLPSGEERGERDRGYAELAELLADRGYSAVAITFRGVGESSGFFSFEGWCRDLQAVAEWASLEFQLPLVVWGFSMGAAVAAKVSPELSNVKGAILAACPAHFNWIDVETFKAATSRAASSQVLKVDYSRAREVVEELHSSPPLKYVSRISPRSLLILHGQCDQLIPVSHAHALYRSAKPPKELKIIPCAPHKLRLSHQAVHEALKWLDKRFPTASSL